MTANATIEVDHFDGNGIITHQIDFSLDVPAQQRFFDFIKGVNGNHFQTQANPSFLLTGVVTLLRSDYQFITRP